MKSKNPKDGYYPLEYAGLYWLKHTKKCSLVCTEYRQADLAGVMDRFWIEIEIKRSKQDLKRDAFKTKHKIMNYWFAPNYYYFLVPEYLKDDAVKEAAKINKKYGVLYLKDVDGEYSYPEVAKKGYRIHNGNLTENSIEDMMRRIGWDLVKAYKSMDYRARQRRFDAERKEPLDEQDVAV